MLKVAVDYPEVRGQEVCPLCRKEKDLGLLVCWDCYHSQGLRAGNEAAERGIATFAATLRWTGGEEAHGDN